MTTPIKKHMEIPLLLSCSECESPLLFEVKDTIRGGTSLVIEPCVVCLARIIDEREDIYSEIGDELDLDEFSMVDIGELI